MIHRIHDHQNRVDDINDNFRNIFENVISNIHIMHSDIIFLSTINPNILNHTEFMFNQPITFLQPIRTIDIMIRIYSFRNNQSPLH